MKKSSMILGVIVAGTILTNVAPGQSFRQYVVKVDLSAGSVAEQGILYDLTDTTMLLVSPEGFKANVRTWLKQHNGSLPPIESLKQTLPVRAYRYADMKRVTLHRRGHLRKAFLIGAGVGMLGAVAAFVFYPDGFSRADGPGPQPTVTVAEKALGALGAMSITGGAGLLIGTGFTKRIDKPTANEVRKWCQRCTIVEQINRAMVYSRH